MNLKYIPKPTLKLSIVIPARNEFPNIVHTIYSIIHCLESDGFKDDEWEIIIVDNGSTDNRHYPQTGTKGTTSYLFPRGIYWSRQLRVIYDPICGNHSARNKGAEIARGEYLFFSDAHMAYKPGFFKHILKAVDESGGIVHGVIGWMGAFPPHQGGLGYQYSLKLGEEIKGCVDEETEILTKTGWKKWNGVSMETEFATVKMTGPSAKTIEYQKPREIVVKYHDGEMVSIKHRNYDALLTPNHRCYSQVDNGFNPLTRSDYEWKVKFAENLKALDRLPIA